MLEKVVAKAYDVLDRLGIDRMVIGAVALPAWGNPRATRNIDLVIAVKESQLDDLLSELKKEGFRFEYKRTKERLEGGKPVKINYQEGYSVDLRLASFTIDREAMKRAVEFKIFNKKWKIAPPEELIMYKLGSMKPYDIRDIESILANTEIELDWKRMEWLADTLAKEFAPDFKERLQKLKEMAKGRKKLDTNFF